LVCLLLTSAFAGCVARRPVPQYTINLDLPPQNRYDAVIANPHFNATVWGFYTKYFAKDPALKDALYAISKGRGVENTEQQGEIEGLAAKSGLPLQFVQAIQMLYEIQTLMVPIVNVSGAPAQLERPAGYELMDRIPWRGPGCTGIIATDKTDGTVYHARNLDFSPVPVMTNLVYTGIFTKGGKEVFRSQMVAGYTMLITGMRMGPDGFAIERNTRYPDHKDGNKEMAKNLESSRPLNGWTLRKIMENNDNYDDAVAAIAAAKYVSTEYAIVSGVKKGTILARDPESVAHTQTLGEKNFDERDDYIIITNFDFFFHDIREMFDPTGWTGKIKSPRRVEAQKMLNAVDVLTPEYLFETINAPGVIADTIFQSIISVAKGLWNVSQPDLTDPRYV